MNARDLMTSNPQCVTSQDSLQRAAQIMRDADTGFVPVVDSTDGMKLQGCLPGFVDGGRLGLRRQGFRRYGIAAASGRGCGPGPA